MKLGFLTLMLLSVTSASAADSPCRERTELDAMITAHNGRLTAMSDDQWQFLRGVFVLNPNTPPGLPYGDKAALVQMDGGDGGVVFFLDGERVCTPMPIPGELVELLARVGKGDVPHEPGKL